MLWEEPTAGQMPFSLETALIKPFSLLILGRIIDVIAEDMRIDLRPTTGCEDFLKYEDCDIK